MTGPRDPRNLHSPARPPLTDPDDARGYEHGRIDGPGEPSLAEMRRVVAATVIGTTVEWYDFFIYAMAAGLVFDKLFFAPAGDAVAGILSFLTVGISFLFRPLGAFLAGHYGDKYGRRIVLVLTLVTMGAATALIGVLPTYGSIGIAAPILLILLRILQGVSAGGEWGGAVLMAVEHAPGRRRGLLGASPQIGVPLGLMLASGVMALMNAVAPGGAFLDWGWRVPFLLSIVLIFVGHWVRSQVEESPVFAEISERAEKTQMPIVTLFKEHWLIVLLAAFVFAGNSATGYMTTGGFIQKYATNPSGPVALDRGTVLWAVTGSAFTWLLTTIFAGWISDHIGRRATYLVGYVLQGAALFSLFPLVDRGTGWSVFAGLALLTVGLGLTYGPQSALYAELFPASIRFSGVSISYAIGAIIGGAFAPMIASILLERFHTTDAIVWYLLSTVVVGFLCVFVLRDRSGIPLGLDHEAEQSVSPVRGVSKI